MFRRGHRTRQAHHIVSLLTVAASLLFAASAAAWDAGRPVELRMPPPLRPGLAALPRIVVPSPSEDAAAADINAALAVLDRRVLAAAADCHVHFAYQRRVRVTLAGSRFLGVLAHDEWYCGAYPDEDDLPLLFDLGSGRLVNWAALLPNRLHLRAATDSHVDGTPVTMFGSPAMTAFYASYSRRTAQGRDCADVLDEPYLLFQAWPDVRRDAVVVTPGTLAHMVRICAIPVAVPTSRLRAMGANAALLDEIDAAHDRMGGVR
jgi:hypothetical protein